MICAPTPPPITPAIVFPTTPRSNCFSSDPSRLPSFSDGTEHVCEQGLGCEHLGEPLDEWQQEKIGHVWHEFVKHAALTEQRMSAPFGGVGLEVPIVAQLFSGGAQERQQDHGEGIDQPQTVPPVRRADMHRSEPHAEAEILCVAETALDLPTLGIQ